MMTEQRPQFTQLIPLLGTFWGRGCIKCCGNSEPVDIVCAFRPPQDIPAVLDDVLQRTDVQVFWMQLGISHPEAAAKAEAHGLTVVQDKCMYVEHRNL